MFFNNTGFVFTLAEKFGALVIFAEHRYYGESLPFGADSFTPKNLQYVSIEQALADYAVLLTSLKCAVPEFPPTHPFSHVVVSSDQKILY
jgi:dipeptidyl-peptidase II